MKVFSYFQMTATACFFEVFFWNWKNAKKGSRQNGRDGCSKRQWTKHTKMAWQFYPPGENFSFLFARQFFTFFGETTNNKPVSLLVFIAISLVTRCIFEDNSLVPMATWKKTWHLWFISQAKRSWIMPHFFIFCLCPWGNSVFFLQKPAECSHI